MSPTPAQTAFEPTTTAGSDAENVTREITLDFPIAESSDEWEQVLFLPYGDARGELGNGLAIGEQLGPEAPVIVDEFGRWWVADNYKNRVARYSSSGTFLDEIILPARAPLSGLRLLGDGRVVASSTMGRIAVIDESTAVYSTIGKENLTLLDTFKTSVYALPTIGELLRIDLLPDEPSTQIVDFVSSRTGSRYLVHGILGSRSIIQIDLPDANPKVSTKITLRTEDGGPVIVIPETVSGPDGSLHILMFGLADASPDLQRAIYVHIDSDGHVSRTEIAPDPLGVLDSGALGHLSLKEDGQPLITVIDIDGVRVWGLVSNS